FLAAALSSRPAPAADDSDYERAPIHYSSSDPTDPIAQLRQRIERGKAKIEFAPGLGYLPSLLRELDIPASSQALVFSRTSFQRDKISPKTPRAIYFNDDAYVGFVQDGGLLELAAADPKLGAVFYSIEQTTPRGAPDSARRLDLAQRLKPAQIVRETARCLNCHDNDVRNDIPGLKVSSVFADPRGNAIAMGGFHVSTHASAMADRFGGWYVTGSTGGQSSLANSFFVRQKGLEPPKPIDPNAGGANFRELSSLVNTSPYLTPHSDLIALMVLEHQAEAHNRLTHAAQVTLRALHDESVINKALGETSDRGAPGEATLGAIHGACEPLVEYLLFAGETKLAAPISGTSPFAAEFSARGPRDAKGRSLRDFDLNARLFKYPLSYLIYSPTFDGLPPLARDRVYQRLWEVLTAESPTKPFAHLSRDDRQAIVEILRDTKPSLPKDWLAK
ncbi:MAG: hypothetical protein ABIP55_13320, partial [Tepidisphaeraceae bacterium]